MIVGNSIATGQLAARQHAAKILRRAHGGRACLHVDVGCVGAIENGCAGFDHLGQHDAAQCLGILLGERACECHRGHGACKCEGCDADGLARARHLDHAFQHGALDAQGRARVDDRIHAGHVAQAIACHAFQDAHHVERIADALSPQAIGMEDFVGQHGELAQAIEMPHCRADVQRLDRIAAEEVNGVQRMSELQEFRKSSKVPLWRSRPSPEQFGALETQPNTAFSPPIARSRPGPRP